MTVRDQIFFTNSEFNQLVKDRLPDAPDVIESWRERIPTDSEIQFDSDTDQSSVGLAIEYRIGLDLAEEIPYQEHLHCLSPDGCRLVLQVCGFVPVDRRTAIVPNSEPLEQQWMRKRQPNQTDLLEQVTLDTCYGLAHFNHIMYDRHRLGFSVPEMRMLYMKHLAVLSDLGMDKAPGRLTDAWDTYLRRGRASFMELGEPTIISPDIVPHFARADLVKGSTIVDVKANADARKGVDEAFRQVVMYALLDTPSGLGTRSVGVYFADQGVMLRDDMETVISASSKGATPSLGELRLELRERLSDELGRVAERYS